jgi:hypothetical protein
VVECNADLGKEWWVSDTWGLGLGGRFLYLRLVKGSADAFAATVFLSATYN